MNKKYVLTADHCFVDKKQINNFRYWCACCAVTRGLRAEVPSNNSVSVCAAAGNLALVSLVVTAACAWGRRLLVFNYEGACGSTETPPITNLIQVCKGFSSREGFRFLGFKGCGSRRGWAVAKLRQEMAAEMLWQH